MAYIINNSYGTPITTVADGTVDTTTSLKLIGKNYAGYGEIQNENFLFLLENFANSSAPGRAIAGQLWFDSGLGKLKFNDGSKWRTTGGAETGSTQPTGLTKGDFWYDDVNKQLHACNGGASFTLIGPQGVLGSGATQMISRSVKVQGSSTPLPIIEALIDDVPVFVISPNSTFTVDLTEDPDFLAAFPEINQGITFKNLTNDISTSVYKLHGTATNADNLGGLSANSYVQKGAAVFDEVVNFADSGYYVGQKLRVYNTDVNNTVPTIHNQVGPKIAFKTYVSGGASPGDKTPLVLDGPDIKPGSDNITDIGATAAKFKTIYAYTFNGTATQATSLALGGGYTTASEEASTGTIAARTSVDQTIAGTLITKGALKATYFVGTATSAQYADLAEKYLADADYEVGTVVIVGGQKEVTAAQPGFRAIGAVSGSPAYMMNSELEGGTYIALKGRVPVKVLGPVIKGQRLVAGTNGTAQNAISNSADVFAIALETNKEAGIKLVECLIL